ncbi:MAG: auxin-binding protein [Gammaproteobacteria bacterium]|nr:auxin-binding protein [Gammaproteobacteria bacterium]|tara:strand:+ start:250 stop:672 length:423 start_codon:yes stop_codon:yes gene_type:complete
MNLSEYLRLTVIIASLALVPATVARGATVDEPLTAVSQPAGLRVSMVSELQPLAINQMHSWVISLHNAQGEPINDAVIQVDGGMPLHNHGLATSPQVTGRLGEGRYHLQGVRFHMNGDWELRLQIQHDSVTYRTTFNLTL